MDRSRTRRRAIIPSIDDVPTTHHFNNVHATHDFYSASISDKTFDVNNSAPIGQLEQQQNITFYDVEKTTDGMTSTTYADVEQADDEHTSLERPSYDSIDEIINSYQLDDVIATTRTYVTYHDIEHVPWSVADVRYKDTKDLFNENSVSVSYDDLNSLDILGDLDLGSPILSRKQF